MSVEMIRFKRGMLGVYGKKDRPVVSEWYADVAAAHHVKVRAELKRIADRGEVAARARMAAYVRRHPKDPRNAKFSIVRETRDLDEYIWLESSVTIARGRGFTKRKEAAEKKAKPALLAYEYGTRKWSGVGPLNEAVLAMGGPVLHG